ncbi:MAG: glycosyl transferase [Prevotella sp.]|nr:glycosyl transferase [Prevotella sp.]
MSKITFVPAGGLANRMGTMASAVMLAEKCTGGGETCNLDVIWFSTWGLKAPFRSLFEPIERSNFRLRDASFLDTLLYDRPRPKNFRLTRPYQKLAFKSCLYEHLITSLCRRNFDFAQWVRASRRVYLASYSPFLPYENSLMQRLFVPVREIKDEVDARQERFASRMIGVHVRRTDNIEAIRRSPIELFFNKLDAEIDNDKDVGIWLATDSEDVKRGMRQRYGERLLTSAREADRNTVGGVQDGLADMLTLSRTSKIYGSFYSTFAVVASQMGGIPLETLTNNEGD